MQRNLQSNFAVIYFNGLKYHAKRVCIHFLMGLAITVHVAHIAIHLTEQHLAPDDICSMRLPKHYCKLFSLCARTATASSKVIRKQCTFSFRRPKQQHSIQEFAYQNASSLPQQQKWPTKTHGNALFCNRIIAFFLSHTNEMASFINDRQKKSSQSTAFAKANETNWKNF